MLNVTKADITKLRNVDVIVNAANGIGVMGHGVAGAIRRAAQDDAGAWLKEVRQIAMKDGGFSEGQCYLTPAGKLAKHGIKTILHAVTMRYPGSPSSYGVVDQCLYTLFNRVVSEGFTSVAVPGLGTGVGNLDPVVVARRTVEIGRKYADQMDIQIVDIDPTFIEEAQKAAAQLVEKKVRNVSGTE